MAFSQSCRREKFLSLLSNLWGGGSCSPRSSFYCYYYQVISKVIDIKWLPSARFQVDPQNMSEDLQDYNYFNKVRFHWKSWILFELRRIQPRLCTSAKVRLLVVFICFAVSHHEKKAKKNKKPLFRMCSVAPQQFC